MVHVVKRSGNRSEPSGVSRCGLVSGWFRTRAQHRALEGEFPFPKTHVFPEKPTETFGLLSLEERLLLVFIGNMAHL